MWPFRNKITEPKARRDVRIYDLRRKYWGHDYIWRPHDNGGQTGELTGWSRHWMREGDLVLFGPDRGAFYLVTSIRWSSDPSDMFFASVTFYPRRLISAPNLLPQNWSNFV